MTTAYVDWDKVYEIRGECGKISRVFDQLLSEEERIKFYQKLQLLTDEQCLKLYKAKLKELTGTDDPAKAKPKI